MNSLPVRSGMTCARRSIAALAVLAILVLAVGCGSDRHLSGSGNNLGFSKASLHGQYVLTQTGIGINQARTRSDSFSEAVVFTADGNGNLIVTVDDFDQDATSYALTGSLAGTYSISTDGTGALKFNSSNYPITMIDDNHFYVMEQDKFATASGYGEKQDTSAFGSVPSGTFVYKAHNLFSSARVGSWTISSGSINGFEDFLSLGFTLPNSPTSITGSFNSAPDSNGRGQFSLSDGTSFAYYVVNSGRFYILDFSVSGSTLEMGQAEVQTGGPFFNGTLGANSSYVFGSSGDTVSNKIGIHSAGVFTADGNGGVTAGTLDYVQDGTINNMVTVQNGSTYSVDPDGRGKLDLNLSTGLPNEKVFWMVNPTRAYFLVNSSNAVEDGIFSQQQASSFSNSTWSSQSAFFMDGFDTAYKDRVGVITPNNGSFNWKQNANSFDASVFPPAATLSSLTTNGNYQVGSNGRVTVTVNGLLNGASSTQVYYLVSGRSGYMVQEDSGFDIGGAFSQQTGP